MPAPKTPLELTMDEATEILRRIQRILWSEKDGAWNPDKEWDSSTIEEVAGVLEVYELKPTEE